MVLLLAAGGWSLEAAPAPQTGGSLKTDKTAYQRGETVRFILKNTSRETMTWSSISDYPVVYRREADGSETVVRESPLVVLLALGSLDPGKEKTWTWDQREYHAWFDAQDPPLPGNLVPAGRYFARFETMSHGKFTSPTFTIGSVGLPVRPVGKLATTWARLKKSAR